METVFTVTRLVMVESQLHCHSIHYRWSLSHHVVVYNFILRPSRESCKSYEWERVTKYDMIFAKFRILWGVKCDILSLLATTTSSSVQQFHSSSRRKIFNLQISSPNKSSIWLVEFHENYTQSIIHRWECSRDSSRLDMVNEENIKLEINWNQICCISHRESQWASTVILGRNISLVWFEFMYTNILCSNELRLWKGDFMNYCGVPRLWKYSISF